MVAFSGLKNAIAFALTVFLAILTATTWLASASTHWVVTPDGRIQSQLSSIFHMKRPDDLVALMRQEERVAFLESLKYEMSEQTLNAAEKRHDVSLEAKLFYEDVDCTTAQQALTEFDLFVSTLVQPDADMIEKENGPFLDDVDDVSDSDLEVPNCSICSDNFTIKSIDNLKGIRDRLELKMLEEVGLMSKVLDHFTLSEYGHHVNEALKSNSKNWIAYLYASNFWRIVGNPSKAIECQRNAYHLSSEKLRFMSLLSMANVLHRSQHSEDAVVVLDLAVKTSPENPALYFTLGNVHATLLNFNLSAENFGHAIRLQPHFESAILRRHAVLCHQKIEMALEKQQIELQKTLRELRIYKKQHEQWTEVLNEIMEEQASIEDRIKSRFEYENLKLLTSKENIGHECTKFVSDDKVFITCNSEKGMALLDKSDIDDLVRKLEGKVEGGVDEDQDPTLRPRYSSWPPQPPSDEDDNTAECMKILTEPKRKAEDFPTVFLSPENKGFDLKKLFAGAGLDVDESTPLPWNEPECKTHQGALPVGHESLLNIQSKTLKYEHHLLEALASLSPENKIEEIGARIQYALKQDIKPSWIFYTLAGTYWRVSGNAQQSRVCYLNALSKVPERFRDVVLTNFASLVFSSGLTDNALALARSAAETDEKDPDTNFLLGHLLMSKERFASAVESYEKVMKMLPTYDRINEFLTEAKCHRQETANPFCDSIGGCSSGTEDQISFLSKFINCREDGTCVSLSDEEVAHELEKIAAVKKPKKTKKCKGKKCRVNEKSEIVFMAKRSDVSNHIIVDMSDPQLHESDIYVVGTIAKTAVSRNLKLNIEIDDDDLPEFFKRLHKRSSKHKRCNVAGFKTDFFTSTWLSIGAKSICLHDDHDDSTLLMHINKEPKCTSVASSMLLPDHLQGLKFKHDLEIVQETGLMKTFQSLTDDFNLDISVDAMATKIALSLEEQPFSWIVSAIASVYWRIEGNAEEAIECLRHSIYYAPQNSRDIGFLSLANVLLSAQLYNDALIVANAAYEISGKKFAVVPFTIANIYAAKGDAERAAKFYDESLKLQPDFSEAKTRLSSLKCR